MLFPDGSNETVIVAKKAPWIMLHGSLDGDRALQAAVALILHPANPRSPAKWYGKAVAEYVFLNAAFLFDEKMKLAKGEALKFRYRCLIRDGIWRPAEMATIAAAFASS